MPCSKVRMDILFIASKYAWHWFDMRVSPACRLIWSGPQIELYLSHSIHRILSFDRGVTHIPLNCCVVRANRTLFFFIIINSRYIFLLWWFRSAFLWLLALRATLWLRFWCFALGPLFRFRSRLLPLPFGFWPRLWFAFWLLFQPFLCFLINKFGWSLLIKSSCCIVLLG